MRDLICLFGCLALSGAMILLYIHYFPNYWRSLWHRQKLTREILENHRYEVKQTNSEGFFKTSVVVETKSLSVISQKSIIG